VPQNFLLQNPDGSDSGFHAIVDLVDRFVRNNVIAMRVVDAKGVLVAEGETVLEAFEGLCAGKFAPNGGVAFVQDDMPPSPGIPPIDIRSRPEGKVEVIFGNSVFYIDRALAYDGACQLDIIYQKGFCEF